MDMDNIPRVGLLLYHTFRTFGLQFWNEINFTPVSIYKLRRVVEA